MEVQAWTLRNVLADVVQAELGVTALHVCEGLTVQAPGRTLVGVGIDATFVGDLLRPWPDHIWWTTHGRS